MKLIFLLLWDRDTTFVFFELHTTISVAVDFVVIASCTCRKNFFVPVMDVAIELDVTAMSVLVHRLNFPKKKEMIERVEFGTLAHYVQ